MSKLRWTTALLALVLAVAGLTAPVAVARHHHVDRIDLPRGWQPEGVTTDGRVLYAGSLATGQILRAHPRTGKVRVLPGSRTGKPSVGMDFDKWRRLIWVAGGPAGEIRAHSPRGGRVVATFTVPGENRFINDLVVTRRAVYATDSFNQEIAVVKLRPRRLPRSGQARVLPMTGDVTFQDGFNANGIVWSRGYLIVVQSNTGKLFRVHPGSGVADEIDLHGSDVTNGDGLELDGEFLYVVKNRNNLIAVFELENDLLDAELEAELTNDEFDVPTTAALVRGSVFAVNARFGNPMPNRAKYWMSRVDAFEDD